MTRRALVTGGAGFIGSHVADRLVAAGLEVEVVDDLSSGRRANVPARAGFHEGDVRSPEVARLVREGRFDVICHLAAQIDVRKSVADPLHDASVNVLGTINLAEAARAAARPPRLVFASTGGALYGDLVTPPNRETYEKNPESPYGVAKLSAELYLAYYGRLHGLEAVALRFANVYGPRQDPHGEAGVVAIFCNRILDGQPLTLFGDGTQTRDYVYVGDVADAVLAASARPLPPVGAVDARAYNVGTGVETSVNRLAELLLRAAGANVPVQYAPKRPGEQQRSAVDIARIAQDLDWRPRVDLADGLAETFNWFSAQRTEVSA